MNTRQKRKQKELLKKKRELEKAQKIREETLRLKEEKQQAEEAKRQADRAAAWAADVAALEARKAMLADMVAVGDWRGVRTEATSGLIENLLGWSGPLAIGAVMLALPVASEISEALANNGAEIGGLTALGVTAVAARRWYKNKYPSIEDLEDMLADYDDYDDEPVTHHLPAPAEELPRGIKYRGVKPEATGGPAGVSVLDLFNASKVPHFLIYGATGAGKTTLVKHMVKARAARGHRIIVCDPHNVAGAWGAHEVRAGGADFEAYAETLRGLHKYMMRTLKALDTGKMKESEVSMTTVYLGEWSWSQSEIGKEAAKLLASLIMGCRKTGIRLIIDAQSNLVEALGLRGLGDLRESLTQIKLSLANNGAYYAVYYAAREVLSAGPFEGWLAVSERVSEPRVSERVSEAVSVRVSERVSGVSERVSERVSGVSEGVSERVSGVSEGVSEVSGVSEPETTETETFEAETLEAETETFRPEVETFQIARITKLIMLDKSNSAICMAVWGSKGGRKSKERIALIDSIRENLDE